MLLAGPTVSTAGAATPLDVSKSGSSKELRGFSRSLSFTSLPRKLPILASTSRRYRCSCARSFFQEEQNATPQTQLSQPAKVLTNGDETASYSQSEGLRGHEDFRSADQDVADDDDDYEVEDDDIEDDFKMARVCDKLIDVFLVEKTTSEDWRKLLAFSNEWCNIREHFFKRCKVRAEQELDPKMRGDLLKLARKLKEVDNDMERHDELLTYVKEHIDDISNIVSQRRKDFTTDFFHHLELVYKASYKQPDVQEILSAVAKQCVEAVEIYDSTVEEEDTLTAAQMKLDDILNSPSLDVACNKIDDLAQKNQLDSSLMLLITKAWAASKESNMMKDEVKDILYHLYMVARGNMQRLVPKEVRIIGHVLSLEDPKEQLAALSEAFSPGAEIEGKDIDFLYTTPEKLHSWIVIVLDAYHKNMGNTLMKSVQQLMNPVTIGRLEILKKTIEDQFL